MNASPAAPQSILARLFWNEAAVAVTVTNWAAILFTGILVYLAYRYVGATETAGADRTRNCVGLALGILVGWALALFWIPLDDTEKAAYSQIGTAVSAFLGGYVFSKADKLMPSLFMDGNAPLFHNLRALSFGIAGLVLASAVVVTNRIDWVSVQANREGAFQKTVKQYRADVVRAEAALAAASAGLRAAIAAREAATQDVPGSGANPAASTAK